MLLTNKRPEKENLGRWRADKAVVHLSIFEQQAEEPKGGPVVQINSDLGKVERGRSLATCSMEDTNDLIL